MIEQQKYPLKYPLDCVIAVLCPNYLKVRVHVHGMLYVNKTRNGKSGKHTAVLPYVRMRIQIRMWQVN